MTSTRHGLGRQSSRHVSLSGALSNHVLLMTRRTRSDLRQRPLEAYRIRLSGHVVTSDELMPSLRVDTAV